MSGHLAGTPWANVFWIRNGGPGQVSAADLNALCAAVFGAYVTHFGSRISTFVTIEHASCLYYEGSGVQIGGDHVGASAGTMAGTTLSAQVCTCISWLVQQRYKGGHPRTYLPMPSAAALADANTFIAAHVQAVKSGADSFAGDINGFTIGGLSDLHIGTVSFVLAKAWRNPPVFRDYIPASAQVDDRIDTQRRRLGADR